MVYFPETKKPIRQLYADGTLFLRYVGYVHVLNIQYQKLGCIRYRSATAVYVTMQHC